MKRIILAILVLLSLAISSDVVPALDKNTGYSNEVVGLIGQNTLADHNTLGTCDFIGNSNTHKFHVPSCSYVPKIKSEHMVCFSSASSAIAAGYQPCKKCNPA